MINGPHVRPICGLLWKLFGLLVILDERMAAHLMEALLWPILNLLCSLIADVIFISF